MLIISNMVKIISYIGKILIGYSVLLIFPIIVALVFNETIIPFLVAFWVSLILGVTFNCAKKNDCQLNIREELKVVALSWIFVSLIGALPFYINKDAGIIDSIFESVSGFSTTGATIFTDVEILNKSILFWRCFTQFIGGLGVLAFITTVFAGFRNENVSHLLKAETPGPRVEIVKKKTLVHIYAIYIILIIIEFILLQIGKLNAFESMLVSFSTAGTGGFTALNSSIATYSVFNKWVITIFMLLFGINFNIYFFVIVGHIKNIFKSEEVKTFLSLYLVSVVIILINTINKFSSISEAILQSAFHVSSIMTSTGFSIGNINIYPTSCRIIILGLMLISACSGSTCGGFKISRLIICLKGLRKNIKEFMYPELKEEKLIFERKRLSEEVVTDTQSFVFIYLISVLLIIFLVSFDKFDLETSINAVFTTFSNVGLCFNISNFASFSNFSKIALCLGMLLGRLEVFPIIVVFCKNNNLLKNIDFYKKYK